MSPSLRRSARRFIPKSRIPKDPTHHSSKPHDESHNTSVEHFGLGTYLTLAVIPISLGVYKISRPAADGTPANPLSRLIGTYTDMRDKWIERAVLHTTMVEQAAFDRNLFQGTARVKHISLRFPETFNRGSPWNVQAGQAADLSELVRHYEQLNREGEAKKIRALEARL